MEARRSRTGEPYPPRPIDDWRQPLPGVDLAVAAWPDKADHHYLATPLETRVLPVQGFDEKLHIGSRVFYIGIFKPLDRPIARAGTIAALDQPGIRHNSGPYDYPAHLVDCRSYDGFSGSPCVLEIPLPGLLPVPGPPAFAAEMGIGRTPTGAMSWLSVLCGMFTSHFSDEPRSNVPPSRYGVGVMLRSQEIKAALTRTRSGSAGADGTASAPTPAVEIDSRSPPARSRWRAAGRESSAYLTRMKRRRRPGTPLYHSIGAILPERSRPSLRRPAGDLEPPALQRSSMGCQSPAVSFVSANT